MSQDEIEAVFEKCLQQPLQKANYWLLQKACILSSLSLRVYDISQSSLVEGFSNVRLTSLPKPDFSAPRISLGGDHATNPEATLISGPQKGVPVHAVWAVKNMGIVVGFRGTASLRDIFADVDFEPVQLAGTISAHGAMYTEAAKAVSFIQTSYRQAAQTCGNEPMPLYLTGEYMLLQRVKAARYC